MDSNENYKNKPIQEEDLDTKQERSLILHNDDYHSFDYVIEALMLICEHEQEQAVQCTLLTHYKGKCDVKKGSFSYLRPMKQALIAKDLKATID
ncbi:ATP-dependent Clp protease adaptor ClpS [Mangrovibacterium diazotrophicum]|uniref:ATP-dependent Clp protease adaptor protein ClpS n=1 Tax=Mangrovibacterium diazotrophicum TaxID=1261403 RepID=A0A419W5P9_9BACT|nr:ATP-dependent Clp protease adaptor ClpS [Mangrovibacterium diazotrophicum]RKD90791.1 ATP-dependent Clp protease adaptor protein ClpS [Mangrovibacterium diazotrophicum]